MSNRQLPLFPNQPTSPQEMSGQTPLGATYGLFEQHLTQENKSDHTITAFLADLRLFADHIDDKTPIGKIGTSTLNEFLKWMEYERGVPCSQKTYARRVTTLKVYFKWLHAVSAIAVDPAKTVAQRSGVAPLSHAITEAQVKAARQAAQQMLRSEGRGKRSEELDTRPVVLFELLLQTGIKKGETGALKLADIDRSNTTQPQILIRHEEDNVYRERRLHISSELLADIDAYIAQYRPTDRLFTCTTRNLEYILTEVGERAGIPFKLSFEVMRWSSAVREWRAGVDEEAIRERLGLSRISWYETGMKIRQLVERQIEDETND